MLANVIQNNIVENWLLKIEKLTNSENKIMLGLERVKFYAEKLNLKRPAEKIITVAGTNGKGSTVKLLENVYAKAKYNVASFTSPHLIKFNERISINNKQVSDQQLVQAFEKIYDIFLKYKDKNHLSYFEFVFLTAWYIYANFYKLDLLILEIGLGGRLDAVNLIENDIAIITSVAFDHQKFLGDTLDKIAFEKAGIIKKNKTAIFGANIPDVAIDFAKQQNADIFILGKDFSIPDLEYTGLVKDNIAICLQAISLLNKDNKLKLNQGFINDFFDNLADNFQMPARSEFISNKNFHLLYDIAHNPHSINNLKNNILFLKNKYKFNKVYAICGMLQDKNAKECLENISEVIDVFGLIDLASINSRGLSCDDLENYMVFKKYYKFKTANQALQEFKKSLKPNDMLVIFGSFYTVNQLYEKNI